LNAGEEAWEIDWDWNLFLNQFKTDWRFFWQDLKICWNLYSNQFETDWRFSR